MIALALGPGRLVLFSGAFFIVCCRTSTSGLLSLPACACGGVFEEDAARFEVLSNSIRFGKVAGRARVAAIVDRSLDLFDRDRRRRVFRPAQRENAEHAVEALER